MRKTLLLVFIMLVGCLTAFSQQKKQLRLITTDFTDHNENEIPGAIVLIGNVQFEHDGANIYGKKIYFFQKEQYVKVFDARIIQGDTVTMTSTYAEYNGIQKLAFATGNVKLQSPNSILTTDTIYYNRNIQEAYYNSNGTIVSGENVLKSKSGRYNALDKKFIFRNNVVLTNPKAKIETNHLDYYESSGHAYVFGASNIYNKDGQHIYTENGFYDTKNDVGRLTKNSIISYQNRTIKGDILYTDKSRNYASATNNVVITDTVNKMVATGHFAELFKAKDSIVITKKALLKTMVEKDSMFLHAKKLVVTGPEGKRIAKGYNDARIFKSDMSAKCDSIFSDQYAGITKLIRKPVIWSQGSQITGDIIYLVADTLTQKMDSIKVLNNAFIIQKDTIGTGYNQMKGVNLFGKFKNNKLSQVDLIKNTESIYYMYNDKSELIGIDKSVCSKISLFIEDNKIQEVFKYVNPDGYSYPEKDLPENARKLKNFKWRGDEEIKTLEDIFPKEELELDEKIKKESIKAVSADQKPMKVREETLNQNAADPKKNSKTKNKK
ncbi:MAG: OstA-like protein [Flavobacterium sp.]|nr:OstA-like protein [Candidatus Neoflavobacterium equi]